MDLTIEEYHDFFSNWYGLRDGTLLPMADDRGEYWVCVDGETMLAEEFNGHDPV